MKKKSSSASGRTACFKSAERIRVRQVAVRGVRPDHIIQAEELPRYMGRSGVTILDMQSPKAYTREHVAGAVNYPASNILVSLPWPNSLAPRTKVASTLAGRAWTTILQW
jgi:hypothetical protein